MNKFFVTLIILAVLVLMYFLAPILTPFAIAALLAYLVNPLVKLLMRLRVPHMLSVLAVFLSLLIICVLFILLLVPLIQKQIVTLMEALPGMIAWVQNTILPWINTHFGTQEFINIDTLKTTLASNWSKAGGLATWLLKETLLSGKTLIEWLTNLVLIPVVTFYLLRDWDALIKGIHGLLPRKIAPTVVKLVKECNEVLSAFFRGQLLVMLSLGVMYSIGLSLVGLQLGMIIGLITGLLSIVPYLGVIVGITSASFAAYAQFGTMTSVFAVWGVFAIGQAIESSFLTPRLIGHRIGLHPVAVIFAVLAGATLCGFFGVLLALPVAAVIMVMVRFLNQYYRHSKLYQ